MKPPKRSFFYFLIAIGLVISNSAQAQLKVPILRGFIKGDFSIVIKDNNQEIKPGSYFNLTDMGLKANTFKEYPTQNYKDVINIQGAVSYKIKVIRADKSAYDGILMFFNTDKKHAEESVCQYYLISLTEGNFNTAMNGMIADSYEYWEGSGGSGLGGLLTVTSGSGTKPQILTWILWLTGPSQ